MPCSYGIFCHNHGIFAFLIDVIVGFEESRYPVNESNDAEVCVKVFNTNVVLEFEVVLMYLSHPITAGKLDLNLFEEKTHQFPLYP